MKRPLKDHGEILHFAGRHHLFPVRGPGAGDLAMAGHATVEGRTPIGWHQFFPELARQRKVLLVDDEAGTADVVAET